MTDAADIKLKGSTTNQNFSYDEEPHILDETQIKLRPILRPLKFILRKGLQYF